MMNTVLIWLVLFTLGSLAAKIPTDVDKKGQALDTNTESLGKRNSPLSSASDDASLVTKRDVRRSVGWLKANTLPVCFGTRNGLYGRFYAPASGRLAAIKLVHLYGFVSCHTRHASNWSFWGCGHHGPLIDHVDVTITTSANHILFPPNQFMQYNHRAGKWSNIPGYNSFSPEMSCRVSPTSGCSQANRYGCGMARIWRITLNKTMEEECALMSTLSTCTPEKPWQISN